MNGRVDDQRRALIDVDVRNAPGGDASTVVAWIDTGFDGHLVFPRQMIEQLELKPLAQAEAVLADGSRVVLDTFLCYLEWFGDLSPLQVIANDGAFPLLGTELLAGRKLTIDFQSKSLSLE